MALYDWLWTIACFIIIGCLILVAYKYRASLLKCARQYLSSFRSAMQTTGNQIPRHQTSPQRQQIHHGQKRHQRKRKQRHQQQYQQPQQQQPQQQLQNPQQPIQQMQPQAPQQLQFTQQQIQQQQQQYLHLQNQHQRQHQQQQQQHNQQQYHPLVHNHPQQYPSNSGAVSGSKTSAITQPQNVAVSHSQARLYKMRPASRTILAGSDAC